MTKEQARDWLASGPSERDPKTWEAYFVHYGRRHSLDPLFEDGGANADRVYKSTPQTFDPEEWPEAKFDQDAGGLDITTMLPYSFNPLHFATEGTADMLADKLGATTVWKDGPTSGPFRWPGAWYLRFDVENTPNAGLAGNLWNREIAAFKQNIDNWNLNLGPNNQYTDPQTNTPDLNVLKRLRDEIGYPPEEEELTSVSESLSAFPEILEVPEVDPEEELTPSQSLDKIDEILEVSEDEFEVSEE